MRHQIIMAVISTLVLAGCASKPIFTYDGKKYESQEQVVQAQQKNISNLLAEIEAFPKPLTDAKLIFIAPGYQAFMSAQEKMDQLAGISRNEVQRVDAEVKARTAVAGYKFSADMIKKRNIYRTVTFVESPTYTVVEPSVSEGEDALWITCSYSGDGKNVACGTYYLSKKFGKQIFVTDRSSPDIKERNKAYLQAFETLAIRE